MNQTLKYKKLNQLKEAIANSETFNMSMVHHDCGTPSCVAGHLIAMNGIDKDEWYRYEEELTLATREKVRNMKKVRTRNQYISPALLYIVQEIGFDLDDALRIYNGDFARKEDIDCITKEETLRELNRQERKYRKRDYKKMIKEIMDKPYQEVVNDSNFKTKKGEIKCTEVIY